MKKLVFIRHAHSEPATASVRDRDRKLSERGKEDAIIMAGKLSSSVSVPGKIISSPAKRALKTASLIAKAFNISENEIITEDLFFEDFSIADLIKTLIRNANSEDVVFIVGHNPTLEEINHLLCPEMNHKFPPCASAGIEFQIKQWQDLRVGTGKMLFYLKP